MTDSDVTCIAMCNAVRAAKFRKNSTGGLKEAALFIFFACLLVFTGYVPF